MGRPGRRFAIPLDHPRVGTQYAGNASKKGMTQMNPNTGGQPPRRRNSVIVFAALLIGGLLILVIRMVAMPTVSVGDIVLPLVVGVLMALAIAYMVRRDRRDRDSLPPSQRDSQDQGMPH